MTEVSRAFIKRLRDGDDDTLWRAAETIERLLQDVRDNDQRAREHEFTIKGAICKLHNDPLASSNLSNTPDVLKAALDRAMESTCAKKE